MSRDPLDVSTPNEVLRILKDQPGHLLTAHKVLFRYSVNVTMYLIVKYLLEGQVEYAQSEYQRDGDKLAAVHEVALEPILGCRTHLTVRCDNRICKARHESLIERSSIAYSARAPGDLPEQLRFVTRLLATATKVLEKQHSAIVEAALKSKG